MLEQMWSVQNFGLLLQIYLALVILSFRMLFLFNTVPKEKVWAEIMSASSISPV